MPNKRQRNYFKPRYNPVLYPVPQPWQKAIVDDLFTEPFPKSIMCTRRGGFFGSKIIIKSQGLSINATIEKAEYKLNGKTFKVVKGGVE